jgi:plastocyanin
MEDEMVEGMSHAGMEGIEGIHIMADGTVTLENGEILEDATVTENGKIQLGSGEIVEPIMDLREGGSMEDTGGMMMEDEEGGAMMEDGEGMMEDEGMMESETKIFNITGQNFAFSQTEIRVKQGDRVRINFESGDGFHDWTIDEFSAATAQVNTGEKTFVEFVADKKGTFEYYCSVGQHRQMGMVGNLIVE